MIESVVADHRAKQASKSGAGSALEFGCGVGDIPLSAAMRAALDAWEIVDASGFRVMIFAPCNHYVDYIAAVLSAALPYEVLAIHGNLTQGKRTRVRAAALAAARLPLSDLWWHYSEPAPPLSPLAGV